MLFITPPQGVLTLLPFARHSSSVWQTRRAPQTSRGFAYDNPVTHEAESCITPSGHDIVGALRNARGLIEMPRSFGAPL